MTFAAELRPGMGVRFDGVLWKVVAVEVKAGSGQMRGFVHARLLNTETLNETDRRYRPDEKLDVVELDVRQLGYLYRDGGDFVFMDRTSFEQYLIPGKLLGPFLPFLREDQDLAIEFHEGRPVGCRFPDVVELKVAETAPPQHAHEQNVWKDAVLENGLKIQVPLFITPGETIRLDVRTHRYMARGKH